MKRSHTAGSSAGFTLIELLVVIGILGVLMAVLLPQIVSSRESSNIFADQANLKWHYQTLEIYKQRRKRMPTEGGHKFVLAPWIDGVIEKTPENMDRYFTPGLNDVRYQELKEMEVADVWNSYSDVSSADTSYAGRAKKHLSGNLLSGNEAWMANDNEFGPAFRSGAINVLLGSGSVRELTLDDLRKVMPDYDPDKGDNFPVGPDSPLELLQKLDH